jgi:protein-disulfide isomerase
MPSTMKKMSHFFKTPQGKFIASVAGVLVLLFGYYFYATSGDAQAPAVQEVTLSEKDHVKGNKDAVLTLVEFGDFQCPACAAFEPLVQQVMADNKDILKFSFKHFPLMQIHKNALLAALASEAAAQQGKFWEMHDLLYEKQEEWSGTLTSREYFIRYANTLELDIAKFTKDLENKDLEAKVLAELREGVRLGVQGTPMFFLNGKKLEGVRDLASFNKAIKDAHAELAK